MKYDEKFRKKVLDKVAAGQKVADVAKKMGGLAPSAVYGWMKKDPRFFGRTNGKAAGIEKPAKSENHLALKVAAGFLKNAIKAWDTPRCKPLVELAMIELEEAL